MRLAVSLQLLCLALAASEFYPLPDRADDAVYALKKAILAADHNVTLLTPALQEKRLRNAVRKAAEKGRAIRLITAPETALESAYLVQFAAVEHLTVTGLCGSDGCGNLLTALLLVDDAVACYSTLSFDSPSMHTDIGFVECTDTPSRVAALSNFIQTQYCRARPYLQP